MRENIQYKLKKIEREKSIKVLFALESGSRAWGFSSKDSDYDVRFVYVRTKNEYLKINEVDDFLDFPLDDELDFNGWDLKKFLKLLYASNATPFEWMQSPVFYYKEDDIFKVVFEALSSFYCQQTLMHHYLGLIRKMLLDLDHSTIKIKKLLYIVRSLLAAKHCLVFNEFPPMEFEKLKGLIDRGVIRNEIDNILEVKANSLERDVCVISSDLRSFIKDTFQFLNAVDKVKSKGDFEVKVLNEMFLNIIDYVDN